MSINHLLSIARTALATHQRAIGVTGHNVANASTPGYTRQRLEIVAHTPLRTPHGPVGRGVTDHGAARVRDRFLDASVRRESGLLGQSTTLRDMLARVEETFGEPSDTGLAATLDAYFGTLADLANDPSSAAKRALVQHAGRQVTARFGSIDSRIEAISVNATERLRGRVEEANAYAAQIAELNTQILVAGGPNQRAPDLEDQRDILIDKLSSLMAVRVLHRDNGTVGVVAGDTLLVDGGVSQRLEVQGLPAGGYGVALAGSPIAIAPGSGELKALSDLTARSLPAVRAQLDALAAGFVTEVNAVHRTGFTASGATGVDFFNPAGLTARTMALSAAVDGSPAEIAAGATAAAGDGAIALQLARFRTTGLASLGGISAGEYYTRLVGMVGGEARNADQSATVAEALVGGFEAQRQAVGGVSVDEEMVNLISQQQAFSAAARLVRVADEMLQDVLRMV